MNAPAQEQGCFNCRFGVIDMKQDHPQGECQRFPPTVIPCDNDSGFFCRSPIVLPGDWCGEWKKETSAA